MNTIINLKHPVKTAILIDGGYYRKRARSLFGAKTPKDSADELEKYCYWHLRDNYEQRYLYRIFYYDCPPVTKNVYHPLLNKNINLGKTDEYAWANSFFDELRHRRKFALRMGKISDSAINYNLKPAITKALMQGKKSLSELSENDFFISLEQKGVDMRIGVDISSLAFKKQVNQIILIAGESDFVPAAKQARREGIDFILDPMHAPIKSDLFEHIVGIRSPSVNYITTRKKDDEQNA